MKLHFTQQQIDLLDGLTAPFQRREEWAALAIPGYPDPHAAVLLTGEPGTGKTTLALEILHRVSGLPKSKIPTFDMSEVANHQFGVTEKFLKKCFSDALAFAKKAGCTPVMFMDECDSILYSRNMVTQDNAFMLSIVNMTLQQIDRFTDAGGCMVFATNFANLLDPAFVRRMTDRITILPPTGPEQLKFWETLMPPAPFGIPTKAIPKSILAKPITPNRIEKAIQSCARKAFCKREPMSIEGLLEALDAV